MLYLTAAGGLQSVQGVDREIELLERLLHDLKGVRAGTAPDASALAQAPLLESWKQAVRIAPCLVGLVSGHPHLEGPGRPIRTSDIWAIAPDHGWCRSYSRWYRLGAPAGAVLRYSS